MGLKQEGRRAAAPGNLHLALIREKALQDASTRRMSAYHPWSVVAANLCCASYPTVSSSAERARSGRAANDPETDITWRGHSSI